VASEKRLGQHADVSKDDRQLQEEDPKKRINWGDDVDNIGDFDFGDFIDNVKDGVGDFLDNITDAFNDNDLEDGLGNFNDSITDGFGDFVDNINNGFGDGIEDFLDNVTNGWFNNTLGDFDWPSNWPNLIDGVVDWANFSDWVDFDFENFTWDIINWDNSTWDDFLGDMDFNETDVDFCSILESAVGIGKGFGIEGNCRCKEGAGGENLAIGCDFQNVCYKANVVTDLCGDVSLNYTMAMGDDVSVSACFGFGYDLLGMVEGDILPEICFGYAYSMGGQEPSTCSASYNGNPCQCEIDGDSCLSLNCSMFLPGASFDHCQILETITDEDITSWLPEFPVFGDNFTQVFDNIDWNALDWKNLDLDNFKLSEIEWGSNARELKFGDLIKVDPADDIMCPILQSFIGMSNDFSSSGGCTCGAGDDDAGLSMECKFENACLDEETCASIGLSFGFAKLEGVQAEACVDFANDGHPQTCFAFEIDVAGTSQPTCFATYGGKTCKCSIDDLCVAVDCSEHELSAVVDTCQEIDFNNKDPISLIPRFAERRDASDIPKGDSNVDGSGDNSSQNLPEESSAASQQITFLASILVLILLS